jgi:hypothetical protein
MKRCCLLLCCLVVLAPAFAEQQTGFIEVTPFGAYRFGGTFEVEDSPDAYELDDSPSFGLILNFPHRVNTRWEVFYSQQSTDATFSDAASGNGPLDIDLHTLQIGGTYQFEGNRALPYLAATVGATHARASAADSESDTFWSGSLGLGVLVSPNSRVGLRLEARGHFTFTNSSTDLLCVSGPDQNACAIRVAGDVVTQVEAFAGVVFRF